MNGWLTGRSLVGPIGIARQQDGVAVREIVRIDPAAELQALMATLASVLGEKVSARGVPLHDALLSWPRSWQATEVGEQR